MTISVATSAIGRCDDRASRLERLSHGDALALGDNSLRLLDDHPRVESALELLRQDFSLTDAPVVDDADGCHVGHHAGDLEVVETECLRTCLEEVQGPDPLVAQPQRHGIGVVDSRGHGGHDEMGPALREPGEVDTLDQVSGAVRLQAGAVVVLQLEEFEHPGLLVGRGEHPQRPVLVCQQDAGGGDSE